jgi:hypothetical protein
LLGPGAEKKLQGHGFPFFNHSLRIQASLSIHLHAILTILTAYASFSLKSFPSHRLCLKRMKQIHPKDCAPNKKANWRYCFYISMTLTKTETKFNLIQWFFFALN